MGGVDAIEHLRYGDEFVGGRIEAGGGAETGSPGGGGAEGEHESITVHEIALSDLRSLRLAGALRDAKTLLLVQALELGFPELFTVDRA